MKLLDASDAHAKLIEEITEKLALLQSRTDNLFDHPASGLNWGHVGDLARVAAALDNALGGEEGAEK